MKFCADIALKPLNHLSTANALDWIIWQALKAGVKCSSLLELHHWKLLQQAFERRLFRSR